MKNRFRVQEEEMTSQPRRRVKILFEVDSYATAWNYLWHQASLHCEESKKYQLIEMSNGILFLRMELINDGRPIAMNFDDLGPDKFGYSL
jgi:hypothetical protein